MNSVVDTFTMGSNVLDQQLGCLWQKDHLLSVSLSGYINYLDRNNPSKPLRVIKVRLPWVVALPLGAGRRRAVHQLQRGGSPRALAGWQGACCFQDASLTEVEGQVLSSSWAAVRAGHLGPGCSGHWLLSCVRGHYVLRGVASLRSPRAVRC